MSGEVEHRSGIGSLVVGGEASGGFPPGSHPVGVYLASLSPGSRRTMRASLDSIAGFLSGGREDAWSLRWNGLEYHHAAAVRSALSEVYAPATANKMLSALRGVMKECLRLRLISAEDYSRTCDIPPVRGSKAPKGRALSSGELGSLLHVCAVDEKRSRGARDYSMIALMYSSGLRRSEVVSLTTEDYSTRESKITIRSGKGNKGRVSPINTHTRDAIDSWLSLRAITPYGGPLFCPISKSGEPQEKPMTDQGVLYILQRRALEAGVERFTPHDLRRTFIGDLLGAGADIATVQQLAGHANVQTTAGYDRRGDAAKRRAADLIRLPGDDG